MFSGAALWKILAVVLVIMALVGYFKYSQDKIAQLNQEIAIKQVEVETAKETIRFQQQAIEQQQKIIANTSAAFEQARGLVRNLEDKFNRNGRDFAEVVRSKPTMVEKRANDATKKTFRCIEDIINRGVVNEGC